MSGFEEIEVLRRRSPGDLSLLLQKERSDITRRDLIGLIQQHSIQMVNFRFVAGDGRLKAFNFVVRGDRHLDRLLSAGERVDGSNLFSFIDAAASDLYVVPRYSTAYFNPFAVVPTLDILCSFFTYEGLPLPSSPENIVRRAHDALTEHTGYSMETLAELEYYIISDPTRLYPGQAQRGYGESSPFSKWEELRLTAMFLIGQMGFPVKYGHSEVGKIADKRYALEQAEIEFELAPVEESADAVVVARWVLRVLAAGAGATVTFAPKLMQGHAGSGLHVHSRLVKDGINVTGDEGGLTDIGRRLVAGFMDLAPSLTAFGNTIPISYLRLVPNQEAPVYICWGERNRSALVRLPLGWSGTGDMANRANPQDGEAHTASMHNQTLEFRSPDGSADIHLLHAGLTVAARHGLQMEGALEMADRLHVDTNVFKPGSEGKRNQLPKLPTSCGESAAVLLRHRDIYQKYDVFTPRVVDGVASVLTDFGEEEARCRTADFEELNKLIVRYIHCS